MSEPRVRLNPLRPEPTARPSRRAGLILWLIAAAGLIVSGFPSQWLLAGRDEMDVQLRLLIANLIYYLPFVALPLMLCVRRRPGIGASLRPNPISLFRMRARLNGVCSQPRNKRPLKVTEWLPLIGGCALAALLYASDILVMLGR